MMMIGRKGASHDRAGCGEVDGELACNGGMLDIGDALRREQTSKDMAVLSGLAGSERRERTHRQTEVKAHTVEVSGADAGAGQDEQTMLWQQRPQLVHERENRLMATVHDGAASDLHHLQPREKLDG